MPWTYDKELPTDRDRIRLIIGDTLEVEQQFQDQEIDAMLTIWGSITATAIAACRALAAKYARQADKWVGDLKILASQKSEAYLNLANELEEAGATAVGASNQRLFAGGIRISQKETLDGDTDRVMPFFRRNMMDNQD